MEALLSICLGLGLSAAAGFRVFLPALLANVAALNGWIEPEGQFAWLGTWTTFWALLAASVIEVGAYYIPFVDNVLDTIAGPLAVAAGTLLTTSFIEIDDPALRWGLGLIMGGGTAGIVQMGTSLLRLGSSGLTGGLGNPVVASAENTAAFSLSLLSLLLPVLAAVLAVGLVVWIASRWRRWRRRRKEVMAQQ